ncbi:MAG TPA: hypothetical protein PKH89_08360 [Anaerolineae bacterium]|nr:hypothetical protein [Anaerolineae bacterium]
MPPGIAIAFRFHVNFYHSYRGDTPDELGFGKDIRLLRHLIRTLDELNARGLPVCGTWDFDNRFSLQEIMPAHCPDVIEGIQRRVRAARDEVHLMSYNNGLINAHTASEFEAAISLGLSNPQGSGIRDLFGDGVYPMVRPQEMMFTPLHLRLYPALGITSISLFYSALPFNGFSTFVPPLSAAERYNPLTLTCPGIAETMTLLPCYSSGDVADHLTLRRWVSQMRRAQMALQNPTDLLLIIDMDADDEFWEGYKVPVLQRLLSTARGLQGLVENVADLPYVSFTTPGRYLEAHPPLREICFTQDTADGSFDGLASWAEKWSNHQLWTALDRARLLELQTLRLTGPEPTPAICAHLDEAFDCRLRLLSTTHLGMSAPVMNLTREATARDLAVRAVSSAGKALQQALPPPEPGRFSLLDFPRGLSTPLVRYPARPSTALVRLPLKPDAPERLRVLDQAGRPLSTAVVPGTLAATPEHRDLCFVDSFAPAELKTYTLRAAGGTPASGDAVRASEHLLENGYLRFEFNGYGQVLRALYRGQPLSSEWFVNSGLNYAGRRQVVEEWSLVAAQSYGIVGLHRSTGTITLKNGQVARFERELQLAAGLPFLYLTVRAEYPRTPDRGYSRARAARLQQAWDADWLEVMPAEIHPAPTAAECNPWRVWKHNYLGHVSSFSLNYGAYCSNVELDSVNNQVTHGWVAVSDGQRGLLVAQTSDVLTNLAFCPIRTRRLAATGRQQLAASPGTSAASLAAGEAGRSPVSIRNPQSQIRNSHWSVRLNPFGSYWGRQYRYDIRDTGLGNLIATAFSAADHIQPYAPSYNGRTLQFTLLIAPYEGDEPPEELQAHAAAFADPYLLVPDECYLDTPANRAWDPSGLGSAPSS